MASLSPGATKPTLNAEEPGHGVQNGQLEHQKKQMTSTRKKWSIEENRDVMICFFRAKTKERYFGKRMYELWLESHQDLDVGEKRVNAQKNTILRKRWFTSVELEEFKRIAKAIEEAPSTNDTTTHADTSFNDEHLDPDSVNPNIENELLQVTIETSSLTEFQTYIKEQIEVEMSSNSNRVRLPKIPYTQKLRIITSEINAVIKEMPTRNITETNKLLYAAATIVTKELGYKINRKPVKYKKCVVPPWKRRLENKIRILRRDLSRLSEAKRQKRTPNNDLIKRYNLAEKPVPQVVEELKQLIISISKKIERYSSRNKQFRQNKLFSTNQKKLFQELNGNRGTSSTVNQRPEAEQTIRFWSDLWSNDFQHNSECQWLGNQKEVLNLKVHEQGQVLITEGKVNKMAKKMKNWKSPGDDQLHGYWVKHLTSLHSRIAKQFQDVLVNDIPSWMTTGRTTLIIKDLEKGAVPTNYRPITCLPTMWKLLTSIIAEDLYGHLESQSLIPNEQKGCKKRSRGTKDQLLIDKMILRDCITKKRSLEMTWIDYRKAYDSVPHSWIIECLQMTKIHPIVINFLTRSMAKWNTELTCEGETLGKVDIKRGIFQGDSLSPLLFIVALIPLSLLLRQTGMGYKLHNNHLLNHLLYMDDLKLYAKNEKEIQSLLHTVRIFSNDIGMSFGLDKCARLGMKRGKKVRRDGIQLPSGKQIKSLENDESYKYLGILEAKDIEHNQVKTKIRKEYKRRVRNILKSKLNGKNKFQAINTYAIPVVRYTAGIIDWTVDDLKTMDRKTRKMLTMYRGLHPRADVDRLYLPRQEGGRGLKSIEDTIKEEKRSISTYLKGKHELLLDFVKSKGVVLEDEGKTEYVERQKKERRVRYEEKRLHGQYPRSLNDKIDVELTHQWLKKGDLKIETEGMLTAAQDQSLPVRAIQHIYDSQISPKCRMCNEFDETVEHIVCGCKILAGSLYKDRHDNVGRCVHWHLCIKYGLPCADVWWRHCPPPVLENEAVKILWDFNIYTDKIIHSRRPDIVIVDKVARVIKIVDFSVPGDRRIGDKEIEKIEKYQDLRIELERLWNKKSCIIPIVIGCLGAISKNCKKHLERLELEKCTLLTLQKAALLGTATILRRVLQLSGSG